MIPFEKIVRRTPTSVAGCTSKTWSFSSACKNLAAQHPVGAKVWFFEEVDLGGFDSTSRSPKLLNQSSPDSAKFRADRQTELRDTVPKQKINKTSAVKRKLASKTVISGRTSFRLLLVVIAEDESVPSSHFFGFLTFAKPSASFVILCQKQLINYNFFLYLFGAPSVKFDI